MPDDLGSIPGAYMIGGENYKLSSGPHMCTYMHIDVHMYAHTQK